MKKLFSLTACLVLFIFAFSPILASAQDTGFLVSPTQNTINTQAGSATTTKIQIKNLSNETKPVYVVFANFTASNDESGVPTIVDAQPGSSSEWLSGLNNLTIKPSETLEYEVSISVPEGTKNGSYYNLIRTSEQPAGRLTASVASILIINVGEVSEKVEIEEFKSEDGGFEARIKNVGTHYTKPTVKVEVFDDQGVKINEVDLNPGSGGVLTETIRKFSAERSFSFEPTKSYRAVLTVATGDQKQTITKDLDIGATQKVVSSSLTSEANKRVLIMLIALGVFLIFVAIKVTLILIKKKRAKKTAPNSSFDLDKHYTPPNNQENQPPFNQS